MNNHNLSKQHHAYQGYKQNRHGTHDSYPKLPKSSYNQRDHHQKSNPAKAQVSLTREQLLEKELDALFTFDSKSLQVDQFPQHKVPMFGLDQDCRIKFENFYEKLKDKTNVFEDLFREDMTI